MSHSTILSGVKSPSISLNCLSGMFSDLGRQLRCGVYFSSPTPFYMVARSGVAFFTSRFIRDGQNTVGSRKSTIQSRIFAVTYALAGIYRHLWTRTTCCQNKSSDTRIFRYNHEPRDSAGKKACRTKGGVSELPECSKMRKLMRTGNYNDVQNRYRRRKTLCVEDANFDDKGIISLRFHPGPIILHRKKERDMMTIKETVKKK